MAQIPLTFGRSLFSYGQCLTPPWGLLVKQSTCGAYGYCSPISVLLLFACLASGPLAVVDLIHTGGLEHSLNKTHGERKKVPHSYPPPKLPLATVVLENGQGVP